MIGTLIGMVQMFANMTDPSKLGPFMAVALPATFYGAALANLLGLPLADKLHLKLVDEEINRSLIIDGILMIREGKSPTLVREMLLAYLPEKHRRTEETDVEEATRLRRSFRVIMAKRRGEAHGGGHGWFVTFADLMGLLVSFFVMLVAFSTQDQAKLQVVAGDAFGVQGRVRYSGIIEVLGLPTRPRLKNAAHIDPSEASATPSPDEHDRQRAYGARFKGDRKFSLASASLRQAFRTCRRSLRPRNTLCSRKPRRVSISRLLIRTDARCSPMQPKSPLNTLAS